jgi:hypothetical protein
MAVGFCQKVGFKRLFVSVKADRVDIIDSLLFAWQIVCLLEHCWWNAHIAIISDFDPLFL